MELVLVGAFSALIVITAYFAGIHYARKREQKKLTPLLGVAETTETLRAAAAEKGDMENA